MLVQKKVKPEATVVLTKSVLRAADRLAVSKTLLARVLGVNPSTVKHYFSGDSSLRESAAEWDSASALIKVYRSLAGLLDGNEHLIEKWMTSQHSDFSCAPIALLERDGGVYQLGGYLDAYRGRF